MNRIYRAVPKMAGDSLIQDFKTISRPDIGPTDRCVEVAWMREESAVGRSPSTSNLCDRRRLLRLRSKGSVARVGARRGGVGAALGPSRFLAIARDRSEKTRRQSFATIRR
jgi:hypothetical protein